MTFTIRGTILQTPTPGELQVLEDHCVTVDECLIPKLARFVFDDHGAVIAIQGAYNFSSGSISQKVTSLPN